MRIHPLAGKPAPLELLIDVEKVLQAYERCKPDLSDPNHMVSFGTSGHRGSPLDGSFTQAHILTMTQAICDYRQAHGIRGPLFMGKDTHALSRPAERNALEVLAANGVETFIQRDDGVTPIPAISRAILAHNRSRATDQADGIVVTPSHNPPSDGGFKYNPPNGGPADTDVTRWIQDRANTLLRDSQKAIQRIPFASALKASTTREVDFVRPYVDDLASMLDVEVMRSAGLAIGVDPLSGAAAGYWVPIKERYGLNMTVVNPAIDPTFRFVTVDHDGKIRMDCSSPYAMAVLWCYLRNNAFKKDTDYHLSADLTGQANHLGVTIEADIIKQKLPENNGGYRALNIGSSGYGKFDERIYSELASEHPIDLCRYQVADYYMGRAGLINSDGAAGKNDFHDAVATAVINKRAGGMGLISGRKAFQRPMKDGIALLAAVQDVYLCNEISVA